MQMENDGRNDFDFLIGTWKVHHRSLKARLKGSTEWVEFKSNMINRKILNGLGNIDENIIHALTGIFHAMTLRLFNPDAKEWDIYWTTDQAVRLDIPKLGARLQINQNKLEFVTIGCSAQYKDGFGAELVAIEKRICRCIRA